MTADAERFDALKQPPCIEGRSGREADNCSHMRCTYEGMDGERYRCDVCGHSYFLDYEEMR